MPLVKSKIKISKNTYTKKILNKMFICFKLLLFKKNEVKRVKNEKTAQLLIINYSTSVEIAYL